MDSFVPGRSEPWDMYTGRNSSSSAQAAEATDTEAPWKSLGASISAISFGFVATAILVAMFLIMAIFEHLFRPTPPSFSASSDQSHVTQIISLEAGRADKLGNPNQRSVSTSYAEDFSVIMPGEYQPTHIAHLAPFPCAREGIHWPSHERLNE